MLYKVWLIATTRMKLNKKIRLLFVYLFFVQLISCSKSYSNFASYNHSSVVGTIPCHELSFEWNGRKLIPNKEIARGSIGVVYDLIEGYDIAEDIVLKVINNPSAEDAFDIINNEIRLASEFSNLFPKTWLSEIYSDNSLANRIIYRTYLIKEKVNGVTLYNFLFNSDQYNSYKDEIIEAFRNFQTELKSSMQLQARNDIYLWDLHGNNVMYDFSKKRWFIVDADRIEGKEKVLKILNAIRKNNGSHSINGKTSLSDEQISMDTDTVIEMIMDLYFHGFENDLIILSQKYQAN